MAAPGSATAQDKATTNGSNPLAGVATLRVQPVRPEEMPNDELFRKAIVLIGLQFLSALFLMLAMNALHRYLPAVPAFGYWDSFWVLLGLVALRGAAFWMPGAGWKWARR